MITLLISINFYIHHYEYKSDLHNNIAYKFIYYDYDLQYNFS